MQKPITVYRVYNRTCELFFEDQQDAKNAAANTSASVLLNVQQVDVIPSLRSRSISSWQPIKTAPKDGFEFLGCTDKGVVQIIKRNKHLNIWVDREGRESFRDMIYWMPLPIGPEN